jgi:hypothetical protein
MLRLFKLLVLVTILGSLPIAALAAPEGETTKWNDTIRDIYIDGHLDRSTQQLASEHRLVLLPRTGDALLFDVANGEASRVDRTLFTLADDHTFATAPRTLARTVVGPLAVVAENTLVANIGGHNYLVYPHQSHAGPMTVDEVWLTAPTWKAIYDHYTPEEDAVKRLRAIAMPLHLEIICATWCGDSKRNVPRLLKAVHDAGNGKISVSVVGIGNDFKQPMAFVEDQRIINVPIVVLTRDGKEIGRFIETPATTSIEADVAALANGETLRHPGRYDRGELLKSGSYRWETAQGVADGTESFELYRSPDGGMIVHDLIDREAKGSMETWAEIDEHHAPDFAEVTMREGEHVTRTRYHAGEGKWYVTSRGDEGGIVSQTMTAPAAMMLPATPTLGWLLYAPQGSNVQAYVVDGATPNAVGKVETLHAAGPSSGAERQYAIGGQVPLSLTVAELNLPTRVRLGDGSQRVLVGASSSAP